MPEYVREKAESTRVTKEREVISFLKYLLPKPIRALRWHLSATRSWYRRQYAPPSPGYIKRQVLFRNGIRNAIWIETGTYLGETTSFLSLCSKYVYSIEPEPNLFERASKEFKRSSNVKIIKGLSEVVFPQLLPTISGEVNFWLDGHYSAGITHKGPEDTPIRKELENIEKYSGNFSKIAVLIDDVRNFNPSNQECSSYPTVDYLVDWARKNNLTWHIEHDIFVAKNF